jgi:hypothetical protein
MLGDLRGGLGALAGPPAGQDHGRAAAREVRRGPVADAAVRTWRDLLPQCARQLQVLRCSRAEGPGISAGAFPVWKGSKKSSMGCQGVMIVGPPRPPGLAATVRTGDNDHCPGRKSPFRAVKRPVRPCKSPMQVDLL